MSLREENKTIRIVKIKQGFVTQSRKEENGRRKKDSEVKRRLVTKGVSRSVDLRIETVYSIFIYITENSIFQIIYCI